MSWKKIVVVLISANVEWQVLREIIPKVELQQSPYGEWFEYRSEDKSRSIVAMDTKVIFFHGGWGKIAAAGSTQYVIDRWNPHLLMNIGTCGGFQGEIERGEILLVERTIVYDIIEQMGDYQEHIRHYTTELDLSWLEEPYPMRVRKTLLVSGDRDLLIEDIPQLKSRYLAVAGDWESGAIAWVAGRNGVRCLILRGVSDLVGSEGGEAYGDINVFIQATRPIMKRLVESIPEWIELGI